MREEFGSTNDAMHLGDEPENSWLRDDFTRLFLQNFPGLASAVRRLTQAGAFRVIMSAENAYLFKKASDGLYKPFLHDGRRFVENVDLKKLRPDYLGALSDLALRFNMSAIAAEMGEIKIEIRDIGMLVADTTRGEVRGAIAALLQARALKDPARRRHYMTSACLDLARKLGALAGQFEAHIAAMPEARTRFRDGWFGSGLDRAKAKFGEVESDLVVLRDGFVTLLRAYADLGEDGAAKEALAALVDETKRVSLSSAISKARLVSMSNHGLAPEAGLKAFAQAVAAMDTQLLSHDTTGSLPISIGITPEELVRCQTHLKSAPTARVSLS